MEIRPMTLEQEDTDAIITLLSELRGTPQEYDEAMARSHIKLVHSHDHVALLAIDQGEPVGMAVINVIYKLPIREARIDEVIVSEAARGHGVGQKLIEACEVWARDNDVDVIEFTSRPSREAANHLYQKLGYQIRDTNVYRKNKGDF